MVPDIVGADDVMSSCGRKRMALRINKSVRRRKRTFCEMCRVMDGCGISSRTDEQERGAEAEAEASLLERTGPTMVHMQSGRCTVHKRLPFRLSEHERLADVLRAFCLTNHDLHFNQGWNSKCFTGTTSQQPPVSAVGGRCQNVARLVDINSATNNR